MVPAMVFVASEAPRAAPTPAVPPAAAATATAATVASIAAEFMADSEIFPPAVRAPPKMRAAVVPPMVLLAEAPAPLTATPAVPPMLAASDAAAAIAWILAASLADSVMLPEPVVADPESVFVINV